MPRKPERELQDAGLLQALRKMVSENEVEARIVAIILAIPFVRHMNQSNALTDPVREREHPAGMSGRSESRIILVLTT